jgi:hypothetical protein
MHAAGRLAEATAAPSRMLVAAERHAELVRRLTPRSQLEQVFPDRGENDPVLQAATRRLDVAQGQAGADRCCRPRCLHMVRQQSLLMKRQRSVSLNPRPAAPGAGACP